MVRGVADDLFGELIGEGVLVEAAAEAAREQLMLFRELCCVGLEDIQ
jgi:hypothetical protein